MANGTPRTDPLITTISVGTTETSHNLREYCRGFQVSCNTLVDLRIAFTAGGTDNGGDYFVLRAGAYWWEEELFFGGDVITIFLESAVGTVDVAIIEWK